MSLQYQIWNILLKYRQTVNGSFTIQYAACKNFIIDYKLYNNTSIYWTWRFNDAIRRFVRNGYDIISHGRMYNALLCSWYTPLSISTLFAYNYTEQTTKLRVVELKCLYYYNILYLASAVRLVYNNIIIIIMIFYIIRKYYEIDKNA